MKRRDLIKKLENAGFKLERNGGNHDVYTRGRTWNRFRGTQK